MTIGINIKVKNSLAHKINSMTKYMECSREDLMEFLIVEAWKSVDAQKKRVDVSIDEITPKTSFVTEGEM